VSARDTLRRIVIAGLLALPAPTFAQTHEKADEQAHTVHDEAINYYMLLDEFEWQGSELGGLHWDHKGWIGRDIDRLWFRSELSTNDGRVNDAELHAMYGRAIGRWWELVGGVRQDFRPGPSQTWAAIGIQGLAPFWLDVEATAYVGAKGRTALRLETETDLLITNRLILQPLIEVNLHGKTDAEREIGAGLAKTEIGLRVRYELRREVAPYVGVTWINKHGKTADLAEANREKAGGARLVVGVRAWF
jgi:copper resistance protein B